MYSASALNPINDIAPRRRLWTPLAGHSTGNGEQQTNGGPTACSGCAPIKQIARRFLHSLERNRYPTPERERGGMEVRLATDPHTTSRQTGRRILHTTRCHRLHQTPHRTCLGHVPLRPIYPNLCRRLPSTPQRLGPVARQRRTHTRHSRRPPANRRIPTSMPRES